MPDTQVDSRKHEPRFRTDCRLCTEAERIESERDREYANLFLSVNHLRCRDCGILMGRPHEEEIGKSCATCEGRRILHVYSLTLKPVNLLITRPRTKQLG